MGPGFKYHVVTIAAIFFALTIGLVVGSLLLSPQMVRSQSRLLSSLNTRVIHDIKERDEELERYRRCLDVAVPLAVAGKLTGRNVALVLVGDYPDVAGGVRDILESAGARVTGTLTIDRGFVRPDDVLQPKLAELHAADRRMPSNRTELAALVAAALARGDSTISPVLPGLEQAELVRLDGDGGFKVGASAVVLIAGSRSEDGGRIGEVDQPLYLALNKLGVAVAMCEPEHAVSSDVPGYRALNIEVGTVDNIDGDVGRFSLVSVLRGARDDYGVKATAKDLMPPVASSPSN